MQEIRWQPVQVHPQRPPVAEVHDGNRPHPYGEPAPRHVDRGRTSGSACLAATIRQLVEFGGGDPPMLRRDIAEIPDPRHDPEQAQTAEGDEGAAPGHEADQPGDDRRRHRVAEARERVRNSLGEATAPRRRPGLHCARRDGERRALADAQHESYEEQRRQGAREAGEDRGGRPDQPAYEERSSRPDAIAQPAAKNLKDDVRIAECRQDERELCVRQCQLALDLRGSRRDVDPIDVGDQVHHAEEAEHQLARGGPPGSHGDRG